MVVVAYHERTKHHFHRYAAALGYMDWATQPDPFRRYAGADLVRLPLPKAGYPLPYWQLYASATVPPVPLSLESVSLFFRYALSLTAWKQVGNTKWPLRANPSSGNLHPTEGYALLPAVDQIGETAAVYHYAPREHALERRAALDAERWSELVGAFPDGSFLVVCRRCIGEKPGSTASVHSAIASTMSDTRWPVCVSRQRRSAGDWCSSMA